MSNNQTSSCLTAPSRQLSPCVLASCLSFRKCWPKSTQHVSLVVLSSRLLTLVTPECWHTFACWHGGRNICWMKGLTSSIDCWISASVFFFVQSMAVGVHGLHGRPVRQHAEGGSKVGRVSATALNLSTAARSVWERPTTTTAVTKTNVLLVSTSHFYVKVLGVALETTQWVHPSLHSADWNISIHGGLLWSYVYPTSGGSSGGQWADFIHLFICLFI